MGFWQSCYQRVIALSSHRRAPCYLATISLAESSFFPIPPDALLIPMVMAKPDKAWTYALITTLSSVAGGILGYAIGLFMYEVAALPIVEAFHLETQFEQILTWFSSWGVLAVFLAGVTPIPYKLFTIAAGMLQMSLPLFILASLVGRSVRFFGVALFLKITHHRLEAMAVRYIDRIGWLMLVAGLAFLIVLKFLI